MKPITQKLYELQCLLLPRDAAAGNAERVRQLRAEVPVALLSHFDRMLAGGKRAVALSRHGVCGECHMRLPSGVAATLAGTEDLVLCETCHCYLMPAPEEIEERRRELETARQRRLQKIRRAAEAVA